MRFNKKNHKVHLCRCLSFSNCLIFTRIYSLNILLDIGASFCFVNIMQEQQTRLLIRCLWHFLVAIPFDLTLLFIKRAIFIRIGATSANSNENHAASCMLRMGYCSCWHGGLHEINLFFIRSSQPVSVK